MRTIFILGGGDLQLDLILEAKKMFFYTIVLDMNIECIGAKWCDKFLHIDIANKEEVLKKAKEYNINAILTSATELGNVTACWVGEQLGLNTNSYQTALNTTNKSFMKNILLKNNILTAKCSLIEEDKIDFWDKFPAIVKPSDSSAGRGLSYIQNKEELQGAIRKARTYSPSKRILLEEYIDGKQFSVETISCNKIHQIVAINHETIHPLPNIIETSHTIPADISKSIKDKINAITFTILDVFNIKYGACHIELKVTPDEKIYIIELASRTGGMRTEMINLVYGISYSQLLLLASLNCLSEIRYSRHSQVTCHFIVNYNAYQEYLKIKNDTNSIIFEPLSITKVEENFIASHLGESKGYYFVLENKFIS